MGEENGVTEVPHEEAPEIVANREFAKLWKEISQDYPFKKDDILRVRKNKYQTIIKSDYSEVKNNHLNRSLTFLFSDKEGPFCFVVYSLDNDLIFHRGDIKSDKPVIRKEYENHDLGIKCRSSNLLFPEIMSIDDLKNQVDKHIAFGQEKTFDVCEE